MKKIISALLVMSMILTAAVAFAAEPVATSINPKVVLTATGTQVKNGVTYAVVTADIELPENTLSAVEGDDFFGYTGTGITSLTLKVKFDKTMFDMSSSIMNKKKGQAGYNSSDDSMNGAYSGELVDAYTGDLKGFYTYYLKLNAGYENITADEINSKAFGEVTLGLLRIDTYQESSEAVYSTKYCTEEPRDFSLATQVGADKVDPTIKPDEGTVEAGETADAKTWTISVDKGYVAQNEVLEAILTNNGDEQKVDLTVGFDVDNVEGGAGWAFDLKVRFKDPTKRAGTTLAIAKKAAN